MNFITLAYNYLTIEVFLIHISVLLLISLIDDINDNIIYYIITSILYIIIIVIIYYTRVIIIYIILEYYINILLGYYIIL